MTTNTFDYAAAATRVTAREVAVARLGRDYAGLVAYFRLTADSESATITDAARQIVIDGASRVVTVDDLTGRDPGETPLRPYWKAARAVRIGLVAAIDKGEDDAPKDAVLRVSLSGEGGGSTVVPADHPLYNEIVALLAGE